MQISIKSSARDCRVGLPEYFRTLLYQIWVLRPNFHMKAETSPYKSVKLQLQNWSHPWDLMQAKGRRKAWTPGILYMSLLWKEWGICLVSDMFRFDLEVQQFSSLRQDPCGSQEMEETCSTVEFGHSLCHRKQSVPVLCRQKRSPGADTSAN